MSRGNWFTEGAASFCLFPVSSLPATPLGIIGQVHNIIWNDIQLSKGIMNKDRLIEAEIGESKEHVFYRSAQCQGVKMCPENGCSYVTPIREKRGCKTHTEQKLMRSEGCPVELVYIYP